MTFDLFITRTVILHAPFVQREMPVFVVVQTFGVAVLIDTVSPRLTDSPTHFSSDELEAVCLAEVKVTEQELLDDPANTDEEAEVVVEVVLNVPTDENT